MAGLSLRLPDDLEMRLNHEASEAGVPRSEVARAAIVELLDRRERERYLAAFINEARVAYGNPAIRQESAAIAQEALPMDNEALDHAEGKFRIAAKSVRRRKTRR